MMSQRFFLADERQQIALAKKVAQHLSSSFVMLLKGDLGVGKTTFARSFIQASGFDGVVKSPTCTQVELQVSDQDFYLDMLFYHLRLRCYVVIELKVGEFRIA